MRPPDDTDGPHDALDGPPEKPELLPVAARRRRVLVSTSSVMSSNLVVAALGAVTLAIMTRKLHASGYGEFVAALAFVSTAMLVTDLGVNALTGREIARTPQRAGDILSHTLGLRVGLSVLVVPVCILIAHFAYGASDDTVFVCVALAACAIPFDALRSVSLSYFVAGIRNHVAAVVAVLQQVLFVGGVVVVLHEGGGVVWCVGSYLVATVVSSLVAFIWAAREVPFRPKFSAPEWRRIAMASIGIGLIQLVNLLYLKADTLILSVMTTTTQVGNYGVAYAIITFFAAVSTITMTALLPILTRADNAELQQLVVRAVRHLTTISAMLAMLTWCFGRLAVRVIAGPEFSAAYLPLAILTTSLLFTYLHVALGVSSVARNRHQRILYVSLVCLVLNVVGNILAIPHWGINGAATVTLVSEGIAVVGVAYVFRKDVGARIPWTNVLPAPVLVAAVLTVLFYFPLGSSARGLAATALLAVCQIAVYLGLLYATSNLPEDYVELIGSIRRLPRRART